ncbi:CENP-Q, a CENPA-CAD centromere complex subunit-domain-containing protein [Xylogone sp. PMI_703]|nr:CENP-Q, a CENPA-CAD centromere complex subunit-domain-containing protein [Xylogone sp. PMI_703]
MESLKRKRAQPSDRDDTTSQEEPRNKRPRASEGGPADTINQGALGRRRKRSSLESDNQNEESDQTAPQGATGPSKRKKALSNADINVQSHPPSSKAAQGKSKKPNKKQRPKESPNSSQAASRPKKLSQPSVREVSEESTEPTISINYRRLAPITRRVPRDKIDAQWDPLQNNCIERISQLLQDVERPVIMRVRDEEKRVQARTAIQMVSRKLISKLSKGLPFPPGIRSQRADDFDFEKVLDNNRSLEVQLTPILHSNELLEAELAHEMELLESEREVMEELEKNAKLATSKRKESKKKLHSLLQSQDDPPSKEEKFELISKSAENVKHPALSLGDNMDEDYTALIQEVNGHLDSIRGNLNQIQGISQAMARGKAAVQTTLFDHLEEERYEQVVLG